MTGKSPSTGVKSALRTLDLIEYVVAQPSGTVAQEIATVLDIPVSSLSYLLGTLVDRGYLRRDGRRYYAGIGLERLRLPRHELSLADRARPFVKALSQRLSETTSLFVMSDWEIEAVVTQSSTQTLRYARDVGTRSPVHCTAAGKALLATMADDSIDRYFEAVELEALTPFTIVDRTILIEQIVEARSTGFTTTCDELIIGVAAVGSAVYAEGRAVAALSAACPTVRFTPDLRSMMIDQVTATARALSESLG
ncbi:IclR family transcriptional regulator [Sphingomonas metalli]|uniref:IclR family transcriptional regulator n=1 Tax=Sphingomonas metalli TaxID=1779358 RepID=A0A916SVU4_9SPHN|nr:IclR family transcriptional regulator [Sphingomonas metalli]GGB19525.1 IclR family transcriptional regulator [Sphingomonas metalli]